MSIEKVNTAMPLVRNISFKGEETVAPKEVEVDEEKSSSMGKMIGLGALAAITIGGIILYARKGRTTKVSSNAHMPGGGGASSAASSSASSGATGSATPAFEPVKKFMKKLEDGTEYLFRTEERDKDGNLVKSVRYAKDGKTIERVREFKMAPAGVTEPAHNVVASEIRYGKNGEVIYKRTANADLSGYELEAFVNEKNNLWGKVTYGTHFDGKRFRAVETSAVMTDLETGRKLAELQFGPKGKDDLVLMRKFDKKTGTKVVQEMQRLSDDTYQATEFGQGQSRRVSVMKELPGGVEEVVSFARFDSQGRLRKSYIKDGEKEITKKIDKKGRELIIEKQPGFEEVVRRAYRKDNHFYVQTFERDGGFSLCRDDVDIGDIKRSYAPKKASFRFPDYELIYDDAGKKVKKIWATDGEDHTVLYDKFGNISSYTIKDGSNKIVYEERYRGNIRLATEIDNGEKVVTLSRRSKDDPHFWTDLKQTVYRADGSKEMRNLRKGGTSLHFSDNPRIRAWDAQGRVVEYDGSEFSYLRNIITETNEADGFKIVYENDFNHPVERYLRNAKGEWEKAPLEF